jgi:hypothetical protein
VHDVALSSAAAARHTAENQLQRERFLGLDVSGMTDSGLKFSAPAIGLAAKRANRYR